MTIGGILFLGFGTSALGRRTFLPRVTLLLIFDAIIGKEILDIVPAVFSEHFEIVADMALLMVGFLIASMVMGATVANLARHHEHPFHAIEGIEWPFMVIFFVLAGAMLELNILKEIGLIGLVYILCRAAGKIVGARVSSIFSQSDRVTKKPDRGCTAFQGRCRHRHGTGGL